MIVHCFGTAGYHPSETRHTSCFYVPELALLLDAGTGLFRVIAALRDKPKESIDVWLSHAHLDHVVGLTFLLDAIAVTKLERVRLFGQVEKLAAVRDHLYHEQLFPVEPRMEFIELTKQPMNVTTCDGKKYRVQWLPLEHPAGSVGYVIESSGKRFAYVTDTTANEQSPYVSQLTDLDLLIHECNFGDEHRELGVKTGHSWLSAVTAVVRRCQPRQTLLVHHNPLAELLHCELQLVQEHQQLKMRIAHDHDAIPF
jgi:ribonuclease Z